MSVATSLPASEVCEAPLAPLKRIVVPSGERLLVFPSLHIDWIESAGNYAIIHLGTDTHVLRETLTVLEQRLPGRQFMRISRGTIVNLDRVRELRLDEAGQHVMHLADGTRLAIKRGIREVQRRLETD